MTKLKFFSGIAAIWLAPTLFATPSLAFQAETSTFTYDALGRVVEVSSERSAETVDFDFAYDNANNRTSAVITETTSSAAASPPPEINTASGQAGQPD